MLAGKKAIKKTAFSELMLESLVGWIFCRKDGSLDHLPPNHWCSRAVVDERQSGIPSVDEKAKMGQPKRRRSSQVDRSLMTSS